MKRAWEIAREGFKKFGGKVREYFNISLKMAWAEVKSINREAETSKEIVVEVTDELRTELSTLYSNINKYKSLWYMGPDDEKYDNMKLTQKYEYKMQELSKPLIEKFGLKDGQAYKFYTDDTYQIWFYPNHRFAKMLAEQLTKYVPRYKRFIFKPRNSSKKSCLMDALYYGEKDATRYEDM